MTTKTNRPADGGRGGPVAVSTPELREAPVSLGVAVQSGTPS